MDCSVNLKRRDSGDSNKEGERKKCKELEEKPLVQPQLQTPSQQQLQKPSQQQPQTPCQSQSAGKNKTPTTKKIPQLNQAKPPLPNTPSLLPLSTPRLLHRSYSETHNDKPTPSTSKTHSRAKSVAGRDQQAVKAFYFCSENLDSSIIDHQIKKTLIPLTSLKNIKGEEITNPYLFRGAPMVTTFVSQISNRARGLWRFVGRT